MRRELPTTGATQDLLSGAGAVVGCHPICRRRHQAQVREEFPFRHIDFVALDGNRVLVILVSSRTTR